VLQVFERAAIIFGPKENRGRLVVRLIVGRIKLKHLQAEPQSFGTRHLIRCRALHPDAAQIQIGSHQFWIVCNGRRESLHSFSGIALLNLHNAKQVFQTSVVRIASGGIRDEPARCVEVAGLNLILECSPR